MLTVHLSLHESSYQETDQPLPVLLPNKRGIPKVLPAVADTGAQMEVLSLEIVQNMGLDPCSLIPVRAKVVGASQGSKLNIVGGLFLQVRNPGPH